MSDRYNRPRTPPSPPLSSSSRKGSTRGPSSTASTSKSLLSKSYNDRGYEKYDKEYDKSFKSSATYQSSSSSSKQYVDDKYKGSGKLSSVKVVSSKYVSKSVNYDDNFKIGSESHFSSQRYSEKESTKFSDKGRYGSDKYQLATSTSGSQYSSKKYDDYASYSDKSNRYLKQDGGSYYDNTYDAYSSFDNYGGGSNRPRGNAYGSNRLPVGASSYGADKYTTGGGLNRLGGLYAGDKLGSSGYLGDKANRGGRDTGYGGNKFNRGGYGGDKMGSSGVGYGDRKSAGAVRSRMYSEEDERAYRSYSPRTTRSPARRYSGGYDDYSYGTLSSRGAEKQYLDRYVIGDSVVYGPPGQYPGNLRHSSSSPSHRPPSPPSPPAILSSRGYSRYSATSPKRYSSGRRSLSPSSSSYQNLTSVDRRPPSPPSRRPPSPDSLYSRGRDRSFETTRSKDRYSNRVSGSRSPLRDPKSVTDRTRGIDDRNRRAGERRVTAREKSSALESNKRGHMVDQLRSANYRSSSDGRNYSRAGYAGGSQSRKDDRNQHLLSNRNARRDSRSEGGRRDQSRRLEDRLGLNPGSGNRRSPAPRSRMGRNAASPRDQNNKKTRRPDDLRLWIESRKNDGKKGMSHGRGQQLGKVMGRSGGDRNKMVKRPRLGDPKRRLGKAKRIGGGGGGGGGSSGGPMRRNKILNKYRRLTAKRGMRSGGRDGSGLGRKNNRSNRDKNSKRSEGVEDEGKDDESAKPGSTASIRRVILKPKKISQVNNLEIKPRIMGKPVKKLLKDPKEDSEDNSKSRHNQDHQFTTSHLCSREESSRNDKMSSDLKNHNECGGSKGLEATTAH